MLDASDCYKLRNDDRIKLASLVWSCIIDFIRPEDVGGLADCVRHQVDREFITRVCRSMGFRWCLLYPRWTEIVRVCREFVLESYMKQHRSRYTPY